MVDKEFTGLRAVLLNILMAVSILCIVKLYRPLPESSLSKSLSDIPKNSAISFFSRGGALTKVKITGASAFSNNSTHHSSKQPIAAATLDFLGGSSR